MTSILPNAITPSKQTRIKILDAPGVALYNGLSISSHGPISLYPTQDYIAASKGELALWWRQMRYGGARLINPLLTSHVIQH